MNVTGIITTYKRDAALVERALQSMLDQTYKLFLLPVFVRKRLSCRWDSK